MGTAHGQAGDAVSRYLQLQISAGVEAVQLFDTWVGNLSVQDYTTFVHPHLEKMLELLGNDVPVIYFRHRKFSSAAPSDATALRCVGL